MTKSIIVQVNCMLKITSVFHPWYLTLISLSKGADPNTKILRLVVPKLILELIICCENLHKRQQGIVLCDREISLVLTFQLFKCY